MDVFTQSLNGKIEEIDAKIQKINYIQEFEKAKEFEKIFQQIQENIKMMREAESRTHLYYYQAMDALAAIDDEIDNYMEKEGKTKEQELNRTIFLEKLKRFIDDAKGKSSQQMLSDLKEMVQEIKGLELETNLFSELYSLTAKALLCTFMRQAKNKEWIDLGVVEEVTTTDAFAKEIQNQLVAMAEEQKEDKVAASDILKVCQEVNEQNIGDLKIWQILSGNEEVQIKGSEPKKELPAEEPQEKQMISLDPTKRTIVDKWRDRFGKKDGTTIYTFAKFNPKTGQYENIKIEEHCFPPKGTFFIKRCQKECIGLEINNPPDELVNIRELEKYVPNLQSLIFGKNIRGIFRKDWYIGDVVGLKDLRKVEFSENVKRLNRGLFQGCSQLTDVKFGENIEEIDDFCFHNCGLKTVKLPKKLSKIGKSAFQGCKNLQAINFPDKLAEIGEFAFDGCSKLQNVKLPDSLAKIGFAAFYSLKNDKNSPIHIPRSISDSYSHLERDIFSDNVIEPMQAFHERNIFRY